MKSYLKTGPGIPTCALLLTMHLSSPLSSHPGTSSYSLSSIFYYISQEQPGGTAQPSVALKSSVQLVLFLCASSPGVSLKPTTSASWAVCGFGPAGQGSQPGLCCGVLSQKGGSMQPAPSSRTLAACLPERPGWQRELGLRGCPSDLLPGSGGQLELQS